MVYHLSPFQDLKIRRVRVQFLSVDLISDRDLDRLESVQNIELYSVRVFTCMREYIGPTLVRLRLV